MGCTSTKAPPAAPSAPFPSTATASETKKLSEYAKLLESSSTTDVTIALDGLSGDSRNKIVEALNSLNEPAKALAENAADANAIEPIGFDGASPVKAGDTKDKEETTVEETKADDKEEATVQEKAEDKSAGDKSWFCKC